MPTKKIPAVSALSLQCRGGAEHRIPRVGRCTEGRRKTKLHTTDGGVFGRDYTLTVDLPAMGSCLLRLAPEAPNPDAARISANKALNAKAPRCPQHKGRSQFQQVIFVLKCPVCV